jgi:hypothetical protein
MRERINWLIGSILTLIIGSILLYEYFHTEGTIAKVLLYLASLFLITIGTNQFVFFFESLLRKIEEPKTPFSEIFLWLIPCLFLLYQSYAIDNLTLRVVFIVLTAIFAFVFLLALGSALSESALGKKRVNIFIALALILLLIIGLTYAFRSTDILLFLPLVFMLLYTNYVRVKYLLNQSVKNRAGRKGEIISSSHKIFPINLTSPLKQTYWITPLLMFVVLIIFIFYVKNLLPLPETVSDLYTVSLTIYTFVLSIIIAFAILILRPRVNKKHTKNIRRALFGLAQMCLVFILVSLLGILIGIGIDSSIFATGTTPSNILGSGKMVTLLQILVFEFILLSFPPAFMYLYAMLKGFLYQGE